MAGSKPVTSVWTATGLEFRDANGNVLATFAGTLGKLVIPGQLMTVRRRCTIAEVNAGVSVLAAIAGYKYRVVNVHAIAVGGSAAAVTTVDVLATQSASGVKIAAFAQASLTQSTRLTAGGSGAAVLADGASFVANDVNTAITVGKTGSSVTTATHIDVEIVYVIET